MTSPRSSISHVPTSTFQKTWSYRIRSHLPQKLTGDISASFSIENFFSGSIHAFTPPGPILLSKPCACLATLLGVLLPSKNAFFTDHASYQSPPTDSAFGSTRAPEPKKP